MEVQKKAKTSIGSLPLPEELIYEILVRVPTKYLEELKLVSRSWLLLISSPSFLEAAYAQSHGDKKNDKEEIVFQTCRNSLGPVELNHISLDSKWRMRPYNLQYVRRQGLQPESLSLESSCNGLLLYLDVGTPSRLYLCNPITKQFVALPPAKYLQVKWALIHDTRIGKYKVYGIPTERKKLVVFVQGDNAWTDIDVPESSDDRYIVLSEPFLQKNELHWLATDADNLPKKFYYVFSVNVEHTEITQMRVRLDGKLLATENPEHLGYLLLEEKGKLCMLVVTDSEIYLYLLKDRVHGLWTYYHYITLGWLSFNEMFSSKNFLATEMCIAAGRGSDGKKSVLGIKLLVHHNDQLWITGLLLESWRNIGVLSQEHRLSKTCVFHSNRMVRCLW